jgi:hypothetical protein
MRETRILRTFREFCERVAENPGRAGNAKARLSAVGQQLQAAADASSNPLLLHYVLQSINMLLANRKAMSRGRLLRQTKVFERELHNRRLRLQDLVTAALSADDFEAFLEKAGATGFDVVEREVQMQDGDNLVGWRARLSRPD